MSWLWYEVMTWRAHVRLRSLAAANSPSHAAIATVLLCLWARLSPRAINVRCAFAVGGLLGDVFLHLLPHASPHGHHHHDIPDHAAHAHGAGAGDGRVEGQGGVQAKDPGAEVQHALHGSALHARVEGVGVLVAAELAKRGVQRGGGVALPGGVCPWDASDRCCPYCSCCGGDEQDGAQRQRHLPSLPCCPPRRKCRKIIDG